MCCPHQSRLPALPSTKLVNHKHESKLTSCSMYLPELTAIVPTRQVKLRAWVLRQDVPCSIRRCLTRCRKAVQPVTSATNTCCTAGHSVTGQEPSLMLCPLKVSLTHVVVKQSITGVRPQRVPDRQRRQLTRLRECIRHIKREDADVVIPAQDRDRYNASKRDAVRPV